MEMKTRKFKLFIFLLLGLGLIPTVVSLGMFDLKSLVFTLIPWALSGLIFLTFFFPKDVVKNNIAFIFSFIARYVLILISLLLPMLIYAFVPGFKTGVSYFWFFASFAIVMLSNLLATIYSASDKILRKDKSND